MFIKDNQHQVLWHRCWSCGVLHDATTSLAPNPNPPKDGSVLFCSKCGAIGLWDFSVEGYVREPTSAEARSMFKDPNIKLAAKINQRLMKRLEE